MLLKILIATVLLFIVQVESTKFENCSSPAPAGIVLDVRVEPCEEDSNGACILKRGSAVQFSIDFILSENTEQLKHIVHGVILGAPIPYLGLGGFDACARLDPKPETCNLVAGETYHYKSFMNVLSTYPEIGLHVRWQLVGPGNVVQVCVLVPVTIKS